MYLWSSVAGVYRRACRHRNLVTEVSCRSRKKATRRHQRHSFPYQGLHCYIVTFNRTDVGTGSTEHSDIFKSLIFLFPGTFKPRKSHGFTYALCIQIPQASYLFLSRHSNVFDFETYKNENSHYMN